LRKFKEIDDIYFGTFPGEVRPDSVTDEVVSVIKPFISNQSCIVGGQSGSSRVLKILRRNHTVEDIENAVDIFLKYNITPKVDMIFGFYFEKDEDEEQTISFLNRIIKKGAIIHMDEDDMFNVVEEQAKEGVDFFTIHVGVTKEIINYLVDHPRTMGIVSRGGTFLASWILENDQENPFHRRYDYLLEMAREYDFTLSLGDGMRPGGIFDSTDYAQIQELLEISKLVIASLLYQYWDKLNKLLRFYLTTAALILVVITSMGIYGFLSAAYQETATKSDIVDKELAVIEMKKERFVENRDYLLEEKKSVSIELALKYVDSGSGLDFTEFFMFGFLSIGAGGIGIFSAMTFERIMKK